MPKPTVAQIRPGPSAVVTRSFALAVQVGGLPGGHGDRLCDRAAILTLPRQPYDCVGRRLDDDPLTGRLMAGDDQTVLAAGTDRVELGDRDEDGRDAAVVGALADERQRAQVPLRLERHDQQPDPAVERPERRLSIPAHAQTPGFARVARPPGTPMLVHGDLPRQVKVLDPT